MKTTEIMTKDEKSLLLYLETCAVDQTGRIDQRRMNDLDRSIAERWADEGFIKYGRIACHDINSTLTHWCVLSSEAWMLAGALRQQRALRTQQNRKWRTTEEVR